MIPNRSRAALARPSDAGPSASRRAAALADTPTKAPERTDAPSGEADDTTEPPWQVVVWNDPVNLMSYVVFVFRKLFGFSEEKATRLMLAVHHEGKAVVSSGPREKSELDCYRLHHHGLWATLEKG